MTDLDEAKRLLGEAQMKLDHAAASIHQPASRVHDIDYAMRKIADALSLLEKAGEPIIDAEVWVSEGHKPAPGKWFLGYVVPACCGQAMEYYEGATGWDHFCKVCGKKRLWYHAWNPYCTYLEPPAEEPDRMGPEIDDEGGATEYDIYQE